MNISLPEALKSFVDEQVSQRGFGTSSEYVRELIRKDQDQRQLHSLLLEGAGSQPTQAVTPAYFVGLRERVGKANKTRSKVEWQGLIKQDAHRPPGTPWPFQERLRPALV